jgi:hypothetical protein
MAAWSPTIEGFRSIFRRPSLPLAEVAWRWSFGAAAFVLIGLGFLEYLDTLPVSRTDMLMLRTGHPVLVSNAISHIARGSGFRLVMAFVFLFSTLVILWVLVASIGRAATLDTLITYIRKQARAALNQVPGVAIDAVPPTSEVVGPPSGWRLRSLAGLHFLRAALALAACAGCLGALILAGFASSKTNPQPALVFFLALTLTLLVWMAWSSVSWLLSLASIFVVGQGQDTFGALSSSVALCRDRFGPVAAVGTWFGLAHIVLFFLATSVVTFPLAFAQVLPVPMVLTAVLLLTLVYFAIVDTLYIGRMAGYVAILEAPTIPAPAISSEGAVVSTQQSALSIQPQTAMVDQEELIVSDHAPLDTQDSPQPQAPNSQVDQDERILSDVLNESVEDKRNSELRAKKLRDTQDPRPKT